MNCVLIVMDKLLLFIVLVSVVEHTKASILDFNNGPYRQEPFAHNGHNVYPGYDYPRPNYPSSRLDTQSYRQHDLSYGHHNLNHGNYNQRHQFHNYGQQDINNAIRFGQRRDTNENIPYPRQSWNEYENYDYQDYPQGLPGVERFWTFPGQTPQWQQFPSQPPPNFPPPPRPPAPPATNTAATAIRDCIRSCPVTSEYNPVCGSNNVTYTNTGRLNCAKFCGVDVEIKRMTACAQPMPVTTPPPTPDAGNPTLNPNPTMWTSINPVPTQPAIPETTTEFDFQIDIRHPDE